MSAFNEIHMHGVEKYKYTGEADPNPYIVIGVGCKAEDIIYSTMTAGLTVLSGSRLSIGAGLWL